MWATAPFLFSDRNPSESMHVKVDALLDTSSGCKNIEIAAGAQSNELHTEFCLPREKESIVARLVWRKNTTLDVPSGGGTHPFAFKDNTECYGMHGIVKICRGSVSPGHKNIQNYPTRQLNASCTKDSYQTDSVNIGDDDDPLEQTNRIMPISHRVPHLSRILASFQNDCKLCL
ncbi:unnamed protein product [Peronospora farinosa]|uniref:Uncharacterized protein n=1 Tax=Peronospora farinosa TaxID=134698 RepID=A0AAV0UW67_9STRA|nr:unnamed protein product [Peronospora farinosa]